MRVTPSNEYSHPMKVKKCKCLDYKGYAAHRPLYCFLDGLSGHGITLLTKRYKEDQHAHTSNRFDSGLGNRLCGAGAGPWHDGGGATGADGRASGTAGEPAGHAGCPDCESKRDECAAAGRAECAVLPLRRGYAQILREAGAIRFARDREN